MTELMRTILYKYIPSIMDCLDESTLNEVYRKGLKRFERMETIQEIDPEKSMNAPTIVEYIINADSENSLERIHYVCEVDNAFKILLTDYPQFISELKKVAVRLVKGGNEANIFDNLFDWENIAIE